MPALVALIIAAIIFGGFTTDPVAMILALFASALIVITVVILPLLLVWMLWENLASAEALQCIPFIGKTKAIQIVEARPFHQLDDLLLIEGFGKGTLKRIEEFVTV